jgi:hypothetical protein
MGSESRNNRLGIGEFVDPWGFAPLFLGRVQYLQAMGQECPASIAELARIWSPCNDAMLALSREMESREATECTTPGPPTASQSPDALLAPLAKVLGMPLPLTPQASVSTPVYRSLPADSPAMVAGEAMFRQTLNRHAGWMGRWGLPREDIGWCLVTAIWGFLGIEKEGDRTRAIDAGAEVFTSILDFAPTQNTNSTSTVDPETGSIPSVSVAPALALLDPDQMKTLFAPVLQWLQQWPMEGDLTAVGSWLADQVAETFGSAAPVTFPPMAWNPRFESRAAAEARMRAEAERAIKDHLDATKAQFAAAGAELTPTKTTGLEHFRWLVRYQVKRQSQRAIAKEVFRERQAVRTAITETAKLIGLPMRPAARPGRPRKSRRAA